MFLTFELFADRRHVSSHIVLERLASHEGVVAGGACAMCNGVKQNDNNNGCSHSSGRSIRIMSV